MMSTAAWCAEARLTDARGTGGVVRDLLEETTSVWMRGMKMEGVKIDRKYGMLREVVEMEIKGQNEYQMLS